MRVRGHELKEVAVTRVSLVDRGANRSPFKIMKRDAQGDKMGILNKLFKGTTAVAAPAVIAIATAKSADQEALKARLTAAGFSVEKVAETDDSVVYLQPGAPEDVTTLEGTVLKYDENTVAILANVKKDFCPWQMDNATFGDLVQVEGVYPTVSTAMDVLTGAIFSAINKAASPDDAANAISTAFDDAKSFMQGAARSLPVAAFKLDQFVAKGVKSTDDEDAEEETVATDDKTAAKDKKTKSEGGPIDTAVHKGDVVDEDKGGKEKTAAKAEDEKSKTAAKGEGDGKDKTAKADEPSKDTQKGDDLATIVAKALEAPLKEITAAVTKSVEAINAIEETVQDLSTRVEKNEQASATIKGVLKSTLPGSAAAADRRVPTEKSESEGGLIDTAMGRN